MLLKWSDNQRRWRWREVSVLSSFNMKSSVPWLCLVTFLCVKEASSAHGHSAYSSSQPVQQYSNNPAHMQAQPLLTGPSAAPPNYYYQQHDTGNQMSQRQFPPQGGGSGVAPGGLTAAATNYLVQQIELERQQQQQRQFQPHERSHSPGPVAPHNSPQAQTLQLLAGLTPQQIAALQTVIPRSHNHAHMPPQQVASASSQPVVAVMPLEDQAQPGQPGFSQRMGPFDKLLNKAKAWLPDMMSASSKNSPAGEPKMRDLHRLPKPPKYPLYDLPSIGLPTPPPAPIMHPMASLPNNAFDYDIAPSPSASSPKSSFSQQNWLSPSPTSSTSRRSRPSPRPQKMSKPGSFFRNPLARTYKKPRPSPEPPQNYNRRNHGPPPNSQRQPPRNKNRPQPPPQNKPPKKNGPPRGRFPPMRNQRPSGNGPTSDPYSPPLGNTPMGYDHPMASNLSPAHSPALGRPLNFEEYMARPSHSYTDDPWNFDPFANQMNQGLHTHALRYNYDPLGMNALDTEANSHLDPNKLSYPGDSFNQDMVKDAPGISGTSQIGGWDKPYKKRPYGSDPDTELTPPPGANGFGGGSSFSSSPSDPYNPPSVSSGGRYRNPSSNSNSNNNGNNGGGSEFSSVLNGGRRGDYDEASSGSNIPSYGEPSEDAPTVDLESLRQTQDEDGMTGLEFTIETSMDKGQDHAQAESAQPETHPLGPMQPAPNPYLSDNYNPYAESSPAASSVPGVPYGPDGFRQRYGRRRTRNEQTSSGGSVQRRRLRTKSRAQQAEPRGSMVASASSSASQSVGVPEGVQIFNEIIRPQLQSSSSSSPQSRRHRQAGSIHPNHAALRKSLYKAIRQSSK